MLFPRQKVSEDKRYELRHGTGLNTIEETAEYHLRSIISSNEQAEIVGLYRMLEDYVHLPDYKYVLNPLNTEIEKFTRFRGRMRNFNILSPVLEMMLSEFGRRNHYPRVFQTNPQDENDKEKALTEMWRAYAAQKAVNELNKLGVSTGRPSKELPSPEQAKEDFERTYKENHVISGQKALDYLIYDQDLQDKYIELYRHYLTCGRPISFKTVNHNDVHFEPIHPLNFFTHYSETNKRIEDRDWAICRMDKSPNGLLDFHRGRLSKSLIEKLEKFDHDFSFQHDLSSYSGFMYMSDEDFENSYRHWYRGEERAVEHYHIQFKSFKRVAILTYMNEVGEINEMEVEDTYKIDPANGDLGIEYDYRNALYETYKVIFNGHEEFVGTREVPFDRAEINNTSKVKLSYNGVILSTIDGEIKSLIKSGKNYQMLYNILKYNFETTVNKNKHKISVIPLGLINKGKYGWDEEKAMYYAEANGTLFVDETSPTASLALQGLKVLDQNLGDYLKHLYDVSQAVKNEWWDLVGFNRQRFGETQASDGKAVTEQAIFRSSLISENLIRTFEKFQEKDYQGILDLSKYAWIDGKKGKYVMPTEAEDLFVLNGNDYIYYLNTDMNVFVAFSGKENEKIEKAQAYLFNATQNGMKASDAFEALDHNSFAMMKEVIRELEKKQEALNREEAEKDRETQRYVADKNAETQASKSADTRYVADKKYESVVEAAMIKERNNSDEADDILDVIQTEHDMNIKNREQDRKEAETASKISKDKAETEKTKKETQLMKNEPNKTNNS